MRISTKGRYALRIMVYLAEHYTLGYISIKDIAKEEDLSLKYVEQIMSKLRKAGLIIAMRGYHGGYKLANTPSNYTVGQIILNTENYTEISPCKVSEEDICPRYEKCIATEVWQLVQATVEELLDNLTLVDLLRMQQDKLNTPSLYLTHLAHLKK